MGAWVDYFNRPTDLILLSFYVNVPLQGWGGAVITVVISMPLFIAGVALIGNRRGGSLKLGVLTPSEVPQALQASPRPWRKAPSPDDPARPQPASLNRSPPKCPASNGGNGVRAV